MSRVRQNFHEESEALINKQINMEMHASYVYLAMVSNMFGFKSAKVPILFTLIFCDFTHLNFSCL